MPEQSVGADIIRPFLFMFIFTNGVVVLLFAGDETSPLQKIFISCTKILLRIVYIYEATLLKKGGITMIDSSYTKTLYAAILEFQGYIIQNHGVDSKTAQAYIRVADNLLRYAEDKEPMASPEAVLQEYYSLTIGVSAFEAPPSKSKERRARAIRMIQDILNGEEPKRR